MPAGRARLAAVLLESSLLLSIGAMFLAGLVSGGDTADEPHYPLRLGPSAVPLLVVIGAYAVQRLLRPRPRAFLVAGALVASTGALMAPATSVPQRVGHAALAFLVGAIVTWWSLPLDREGDRLIGATAWTWRELLFTGFLVFLGGMPSMIAGGFVLVVPSMVVALLIVGRNLRLELATLRHGDRGRSGAVARLLVGLFLGQMALGMVFVGPLLSLGAGLHQKARAGAAAAPLTPESP